MDNNNTRMQLIIVASAFMIHFLTHGIVYSFGVIFIAVESQFDATKAEIAWIGSITTSMVYLGVIFLALDSQFDATKGEIAWIGSITTSMVFLGGPITGYLTSRFGCRWVAVWGSLAGCLGYGISVFVSNLYILYLTIGVIAGCGIGLLFLPAVVAVTLAFDKYRTVACGVSLCGAGIGAFVFNPLQKVFLDSYSWNGTLLLNAGIILNCIIFALMLKPRNVSGIRNSENRKEDKYSKDGIDAEAEGPILNNYQESCHRYTESEINQTSTNTDYCSRDIQITTTDTNVGEIDGCGRCSQTKHVENEDKFEVIIEVHASGKESITSSFMNNFSIMKEPLFVMFVVSQFLYFFGCYLPFMYIPGKAKSVGIDEHTAAWIVSTVGLSSMVSRVVLGYTVDRLSMNRVKFMTGTLLLGGISTAFGPLYRSLWILLVYATVFGASVGVVNGFTTAVIVDMFGLEKLNEAYGMTNLFAGLGVLLGPPFTGLLFDITGNYDATFIATGVAVGLAGVIMVLTRLLKKN